MDWLVCVTVNCKSINWLSSLDMLIYKGEHIDMLIYKGGHISIQTHITENVAQGHLWRSSEFLYHSGYTKLQMPHPYSGVLYIQKCHTASRYTRIYNYI